MHVENIIHVYYRRRKNDSSTPDFHPFNLERKPHKKRQKLRNIKPFMIAI